MPAEERATMLETLKVELKEAESKHEALLKELQVLVSRTDRLRLFRCPRRALPGLSEMHASVALKSLSRPCNQLHA